MNTKVTIFLAAVVACFSQSVSAQVCPTAADLLPCSCSEEAKIISCNRIPEDFDIKATFEKASQSVDPSTVFEELRILETGLTSIPANAIPTLKFKKFWISFNDNLAHISAQAFRDTYQVTTYLNLIGNALTADIFPFVSQFKVADTMWISENKIESIPELAFGHLPELTFLSVRYNSIRSIGGGAFARLPKLQDLGMEWNNVQPNETSPLAFSGLNREASVDLTWSTAIDSLDINIFELLILNAKKVYVGGAVCDSPGHGCRTAYLQCDSRANWLCAQRETLQDKLFGFRCQGWSDPDKFIWEYCASPE